MKESDPLTSQVNLSTEEKEKYAPSASSGISITPISEIAAARPSSIQGRVGGIITRLRRAALDG
jgi:hypothetical protein